MSKFDKSPWQERLIEMTFDVVKANKCLPAKLINEIVMFRIVHGKPFGPTKLSAADKENIKYRLAWSRTLLANTGFLMLESKSKLWTLANGGVAVGHVLGAEVIATRSAMRPYLYE